MKAQKKSALKDERLAEVYRTAAQIILRKGYDATSINDIANALGMTKAGLYHYINGKKELLFDIMNFGLDELDEEVVTPACSIADASSRLRFIITSHARLVMGGQGAITILVDASHARMTVRLAQSEDTVQLGAFSIDAEACPIHTYSFNRICVASNIVSKSRHNSLLFMGG